MTIFSLLGAMLNVNAACFQVISSAPGSTNLTYSVAVDSVHATAKLNNLTLVRAALAPLNVSVYYSHVLPSAPTSASSSAILAVAIAVPAVVVCALLVALVVYFRRRNRHSVYRTRAHQDNSTLSSRANSSMEMAQLPSNGSSRSLTPLNATDDLHSYTSNAPCFYDDPNAPLPRIPLSTSNGAESEPVASYDTHDETYEELRKRTLQRARGVAGPVDGAIYATVLKESQDGDECTHGGRSPRDTSVHDVIYEETYQTSTSALRTLRYPRKQLRFVDQIGQGQFGKVFIATATQDHDAPPRMFAVKMLKIAGSSPEQSVVFLREAEILAELHHPNVVRIVGVCMPDSPWLIIMEYCEYNDLRSFLRALLRYQDLRMTLTEINSIAAQVAAGMEHLAEHLIIHRDLAARNCLVARGTVVKIADFGMARKVQGQEDMYSVVGVRELPIFWMAVESLRFGVYTLQSDIWSFGVLLWEIATYGTLCPYEGAPDSVFRQQVYSGKRLRQPAGCPDSLYAMMRRCWLVNPSARPTFAQLHRELHTAVAADRRGVRDLGALMDQRLTAG